MAVIQTLVLLASLLIASAQRPSFAGIRPIGYPELVNKTTSSGLEDKFGEGTTQRLPIEAQGDRDLVDRLSKLPKDKQPFWFINWQALEAQREKPQTYPQRPNPFIEANLQNTNSVPQFQNTNPVNTGISNSGIWSQPPNFKVQAPTRSQDTLNNVNVNSNVDNRYNTEASTAAVSSTGTHNTATSNDKYKPKPVPSNDDIKRPVPSPGLIPVKDSDIKKTQGSTVIPHEESEFEDIQVKKFVKNQ